jgi:hypothetical protein
MEAIMGLTYRGVEYDPKNVSVETTEGKTIGKYRGAEIHQHIAKRLPRHPKAHGLKYRGVPVE